MKSPKVYWRDSGFLHALLGLRTARDVMGHPKCGASWEGFALETLLHFTQPDEAYFWGTHSGAELDALLFRGGMRFGFEIKRADAPRKTPSMDIAYRDLKLQHLFVLYPGSRSYQIEKWATAMPLAKVPEFGTRIFQKKHLLSEN